MLSNKNLSKFTIIALVLLNYSWKSISASASPLTDLEQQNTSYTNSIANQKRYIPKFAKYTTAAALSVLGTYYVGQKMAYNPATPIAPIKAPETLSSVGVDLSQTLTHNEPHQRFLKSSRSSSSSSKSSKSSSRSKKKKHSSSKSSKRLSNSPNMAPSTDIASESDDCLFSPQFDPDQESRAEELLSIQEKIDNGRRFHSFDGLEENFLEISRGPVLETDSYAMELAFQEAVDLDRRSDPAIDQFVAGLLLAEQVPVDTMEDLEGMYEYFTGVLPIPKGLKNWKNDTFFGDLRRTYLGHSLRKIQTPLFDLNLSSGQLIQVLGHDQGLEACELYGIDLMDVADYNTKDGRPNYVPGAQAMFMIDGNSQLIPIGIKLSSGLVYTPLDSANEWTLAKIALSVAEVVWTSANHFTSTHLIVEPIRVEMMRHLSTRHPVHALLSHHMKNLFGNTLVGLLRLFSAGTVLDQLSGWGAKGYTNYLSYKHSLGSDFNRTLANELADRGLDHLPGYRQGDDSKATLAVVREFVYSYLQEYYGAYDCDDIVQNDYEVQEWAQAIASDAENGANILNFPSSFGSFDELVDAVTHIIYLVGIKHHAMNSDAVWHGNPLPGSALALWAPLPTTKNVDIDLRSFLPPGKELITFHLVFYEAFLRKLNKEDSLLYSYIWPQLGKKSDSEIRAFQRKLLEIQSQIREREKNHDGIEYDILTGENLPYFIWI